MDDAAMVTQQATNQQSNDKRISQHQPQQRIPIRTKWTTGESLQQKMSPVEHTDFLFHSVHSKIYENCTRDKKRANLYDWNHGFF